MAKTKLQAKRDLDEAFAPDEPGRAVGGMTVCRMNVLPTKKHGGPRPGAGRPPEARAKVRSHSKAVAARIVTEGPIYGNWPPLRGTLPELPDASTPLDVLIEAMREAYRIGGPIAAAPFAERAAPYIHGRVSSIELRNPFGSAGGVAVPFRVEFVDPSDTLDQAGE